MAANHSNQSADTMPRSKNLGPISMANNMEISNKCTSIHNELIGAPPGFSPLLSPNCARSSGSETSPKVCQNQGESSKSKNLTDVVLKNRDEEVAGHHQQIPPCMDTSSQAVRGKGNMVAPIASAVHAKFSVKAEPFSGTQNLNPHPTAQSSVANAPDPRRMPPHFRVLGNPSFLSTERRNQLYCLAESMQTGNSDKGGEGSRKLVYRGQWDRNVRRRIKYGRQYMKPVSQKKSGASRNSSVRTQAGSIDSSQGNDDTEVGTGTDENKSEVLASSAGWEDKSIKTKALMLSGEGTTEASVSYGWDESSNSQDSM